MSRVASPSAVDSQLSKRTNRKWNYEEDVALVSCMVDLRNIGSYNADTGFKAGYLLELERMLGKKIPNANIKGKPHIESRIKTLKKDWAIVYDMVNGDHTSGFGWDSERNMVTAEDSVWESYLISHKDAAPFRTRRFHFFNELCEIYAKDHATGKDAQTAADILEEIQTEGIHGSPSVGLEDEFHSQHVGSDDMEISFAPPNSSSKKRKASEINEPNTADAFIKATTLLTDKMVEVGEKLSQCVGTEMRLEKRAEELDVALDEIEGLTEDEKDIALSKIPDHPSQMVVFFSLLPSRRLRWVRKFLSTH
ncbi:hypothetical protein PTKIN_Ptkin09bG0284400 [Pterospermum kingtungense]